MGTDEEKTRQVDAMEDEPADGAQSEATVMVTSDELKRATAAKSAAPRPLAPLPVPDEEPPGGALQVLGGIGAFLLIAPLVFHFLPMLQGGGDLRQ